MQKVEGTVNLSISELDGLRDKINILTNERNNLLSHQKEVKITFEVTESGYKQVAKHDYRGYGIRWENEHYKNIIKNEIQFVNLDEVISDIRKEEENKVIEKLGGLEREIIRLKTKEQTILTNHQKEIDKITENNLKTFKDLNKIIDDKQKEIDILNGKEVDRTKDELIEELYSQIEGLRNQKNKTFWQYIFGI